jgi:hypothetical protein
MSVSIVTASLVIAALARLPSPAPGDGLVESSLSDGIRLSVLEAREAPRQAFLVFLPLGLAHDDAGRAQWSHLLEHLLIRTTDPEGLSDGAVNFNGETTEGYLRLELDAPPAEAGRAAQKLLAWIAARKFEETSLAREKKNIALEIENTASRGFTHKWAAAAWAQAVRHGAKEVALLGDVERATVADAEAYAAAKIEPGPRIRIVAVGPLAAAEVRSLFETDAAKGSTTKPGAAPAATAAASKPSDLAHGELAASWDLPRFHYLEWYLLPDATPADRTLSQLLANLLAMKLQSDAELSKAKVVALASADVVVPQGRVLLLSASLPDAAAKEFAAKAFRRAIDGMEQAPGGSLDGFLTMARNEMAGLPDFAAYRKRFQGRPGVDLLEAQLVLALASREWSSRLSFAELGAATRELAPKSLLELRSSKLGPEQASHLLLSPRGDARR